MSRYHVILEVFARTAVDVEAGSEAEAVDKAIDNCYPSLCHACTGVIELGEIGEVIEIQMLDA